MTAGSTTPASAGAGFSGAPAARSGGRSGPLRNGNHRGNPNLAPRCGARARSGCPCRAPAMANGRCRMHGGTSTGPRTKEGMARMIAALTKHGKHGAAGAPQRAEQRHIRTLVVRYRLMAAATRLQAYLPPEMAARFVLGPKELSALKHPSQVAFEMRQAATPSNVKEGAKGKKRSAGTGRAAADTGVVLRARETERLAVRAEAAACAPWRAAIAFARAAKRAARGASPRPGNRTTRSARSQALQRESAVPAAGLRTGAAGPPRGAATALPGPGAAVRGSSPRGRSLGVRAAQQAAAGRHRGAEPGAPPRLTRLTPTKAVALRSTISAGTWDDADTRAALDARFGPAAQPGWQVPLASPAGIAAVPGSSCAQLRQHPEAGEQCLRPHPPRQAGCVSRIPPGSPPAPPRSGVPDRRAGRVFAPADGAATRR